MERRFGDTSLVIYYEYLTSMESCFKVTAKRHFKIAFHLPSYVTVYDYYDTSKYYMTEVMSCVDQTDETYAYVYFISEKFGIKQYEGKVMQLCDICEDTDCRTLSCENKLNN